MAHKPVERLDQALKHVEFSLQLVRLVHDIQCKNDEPLDQRIPCVGPLAHFQDLREHLLNIRSPEEFDLARFGATGPLYEKGALKDLCGCGTFFIKLASWVTQSKRVWHLNEDLQLMLMASSFGDMRCSEIPWPFETFGISLEVPITCTDGERGAFETDFLLASRPHTLPDVTKANIRNTKLTPQQDHSVRAVVLNSALARWRPPEQSMARARGYISGKNKIVPDLNQLGQEIILPGRRSTLAMLDCIELALPVPESTRIDTALNAMSYRLNHKEAALVWRIVVGLCFYLETLTHDSPYRNSSRTARKPHTTDLSAITAASEVCSVSSSRTLAPEHRKVLREVCIEGRGGWELPVHFRIAHMRRPWGTAHDPNQKKTVSIPFTIVNRARLPGGAVPKGSQVDL